MSDSKLLIMLGSGPGIGVGVSKLFASHGFDKIALLSRNSERLKVDAESVKNAANPGAEVKTYPVDLADTKAIEKVLAQVGKELGTPEVVVYNASHVTPSKLGEYSEEEVEMDLKIATIGVYTVAKILLPQLVSLVKSSPATKPSFLVTSGGLFKTPFSPYFSLSLSKAAQHSLTMSLSQEYAKLGVHVAAMVVHGLVKPEGDPIFGPGVVAEYYWRLYEQGASGEKEVWISPADGDKQSKEWQARLRTETL